jgi:cell wall-associated NlpC family hydrolase
MKTLLYALAFLLLLSACSSKVPAPVQSISSTQSPAVKKLYAQYNYWRGTPYKYGGLSLKGVDCSGFVHQTYKAVYNISLPRSTNDQIRRGQAVSRTELKTGDLLFFKTGWKVRHVGIYVEKGKFMHASSSRGVTISNIKDAYWRKSYTQARRPRG